jgi:Na+:H+ antiporter, NhaA family
MAQGPKIELPVLEVGPSLPAERLFAPMQRFMNFEASGGIVLLVAAVVALIWANSSWAPSYESLRQAELALGHESFGLKLTVEHWINDALMAIFFFLVGLEIKREILVGELSSWKKAALPVAGALGGMLVPAAIFAALNWGQPTIRGWGIPMATDIAFALGVLSLGARGAPIGLRVFLATLAVADDIGALLVIAVFYTENLRLEYLGIGGVLLLAMVIMGQTGVRRAWPFAVMAAVLWVCVYKSGIHSTIAGVLAAATIPVRQRVDGRAFLSFSRALLEVFERSGPDGKTMLTKPAHQAVMHGLEDASRKVQTPLQIIEYALVPWVAFAIVPIFALANAGVAIGRDGLANTFLSRECLGVALGLLIGKPIGITLLAWFAVKGGIGALPKGVSWLQIHAVSWLAGIGFTMSLFIANLAFAKGDAANGTHYLDHAKVGILSGSFVAAVVGLVLLKTAKNSSTPDQP